jgi:NAD+ synthase (glutamine-hydrolysing)
VNQPLPFHSIHRHGLVRVAAATPAVFVADPAANAGAVLELAARVEAEGVDLAVFPELCLTAYAIDDLLTQQTLLDAARDALARVVTATERMRSVLIVGLPLERNGRLYNCAAVVTQGRVLGVVPKSFLPNYREYYEKRWFAAGAGIVGETIELGGVEVPFGTDLLFRAANLADFTFHVEICEDFWTPAPASAPRIEGGATVLCNLSASNITVGKS